MKELAIEKPIQNNSSILSPEIIAKLVLNGDCSLLSSDQKIEYMRYRCEQLGIDLAEKPFEFIVLNGKEVMYATKACTDALCRIRLVTRQITSREKVDDVYIITARATDPSGRSDESTGVVPLVKEDGTWEQAQSGKKFFKKNGKLIKLNADEFANAIMKAETKAKRRAVLSLFGLGMLDETELETIPREEFKQKGPKRPQVSIVESAEAFGAFGAPLPIAKPKMTIDEALQGDNLPVDWGVIEKKLEERVVSDVENKLSFPEFAVKYSDVLSIYNGVSINELESDDIKKIYNALSSLEEKAKKDDSKQELTKLKKQTRDALDKISSKNNEKSAA